MNEIPRASKIIANACLILVVFALVALAILAICMVRS